MSLSTCIKFVYIDKTNWFTKKVVSKLTSGANPIKKSWSKFTNYFVSYIQLGKWNKILKTMKQSSLQKRIN
jgi:hypothetical protein